MIEDPELDWSGYALPWSSASIFLLGIVLRAANADESNRSSFCCVDFKETPYLNRVLQTMCIPSAIPSPDKFSWGYIEAR